MRKRRGLSATGERILKLTWLSDLIVRSGLHFKPRQWTAIAVGLGVATGVVVAAFNHQVVFAGLTGVGAAIGLPLFYLNMKAGKRAKQLSIQLPDALDVITCSLEAGHPSADRHLPGRPRDGRSDRLRVRHGRRRDRLWRHPRACHPASGRERCRHPDIDLFAATIRLQDPARRQPDRPSEDERPHRARAAQAAPEDPRAASSEGRISAIIPTSAPFVVFGILQLLSPHYYGEVWHQRAIKVGLAGLGGWMFLGNLVMRRMIDMRI